jgi:hypothetical protein
MTPDSSNTIGQTPNTGAVVAPASGSIGPLLIYGLGECAVFSHGLGARRDVMECAVNDNDDRPSDDSYSSPLKG